MTVEIGKKAPDFSGPSTNGEAISRAWCQGHYGVLYFYPKDDTPGCTLESCGFRDYYDQFKALDARVVGISKDSLASHEKFVKKFQLPFPLLADESTEMCQAFQVFKEKSLYGRTYMGIERSTFLLDPQGIVRALWRDVKVGGHVEEVLETLKKIQTQEATP